MASLEIQFHCADIDLCPQRLQETRKEIVCEITLGPHVKTYNHCYMTAPIEIAHSPFVRFICRRWVEVIFCGWVTVWYPKNKKSA